MSKWIKGWQGEGEKNAPETLEGHGEGQVGIRTNKLVKSSSENSININTKNSSPNHNRTAELDMNHAFLQYKKSIPMLRSALCSCEGLSQGFAARAIPLQFSLFRVKNLSSAFKKINNNNNNKKQHLPCGEMGCFAQIAG